MGTENEATVKAFLAAIHAAEVPDFDQLMSFIAVDGRYHTLVPDGKVFIGHDAIRQVLQTQFETYNDCECEIHAIGSGGPYVFTERTDHVTLLKDRRKVASRVCAVFEMNDAHLIENWREYWDTGNIVRQMGISREALEKDIG